MGGISKIASKKTGAAEGAEGARRMQLRYGFNEIYGWWALSGEEQRQRVQRRLRQMGTQVVRVFVFYDPVPDVMKDWHLFAGYMQAVLDAGAKPMVTFARFHPPFDDDRNIRNFAARCSEVVWGCLEQWGGQEVKDWYWCVWNEPNNHLVGGDVTFAQYRRIYEEVAKAVIAVLEPHLGGQRARIGGPAVDSTHRAYWMDWIAHLLNEFDDNMLSFVSWHQYGDWRPAVPSATIDVEMWGAPETPRGRTLEALLMAQTPGYEARARGVARLLKDRAVLNVCGELNTLSHHRQYYTLGLNQNMFGAAYYASALIHLLRGGADLEMRWTATGWDDGSDDAYALMSKDGDPMPAGLAKQLFAQHVVYGDWVRFPASKLDAPDVDAVVAWNDEGRRSGVFVNTASSRRLLTVSDWDDNLLACPELLRLDASTGGRVVREPFIGTVALNGYGVAVVSNAAKEPDVD